MFYTTSQIIKIRLKNFFEILAGALFFAVILFVLLLMGISDEFCNAVRGDVVAFGLAGLAAYVYYRLVIRYHEAQKAKAAARRRNAKTASRKKAVAPAHAPIVAPAPVVKPVFFDFEAHE